MRKLFLLALVCLAHSSSTYAQGSRKDDIAISPSGKAVPFASVYVCTDSATGVPCSPLVTLYTDTTLAHTAPNPVTGDPNGNYHFYAPPGKYTIQINGTFIQPFTYNDVILPCDPSFVYNSSFSFCQTPSSSGSCIPGGVVGAIMQDTGSGSCGDTLFHYTLSCPDGFSAQCLVSSDGSGNSVQLGTGAGVWQGSAGNCTIAAGQVSCNGGTLSHPTFPGWAASPVEFLFFDPSGNASVNIQPNGVLGLGHPGSSSGSITYTASAGGNTATGIDPAQTVTGCQIFWPQNTPSPGWVITATACTGSPVATRTTWAAQAAPTFSAQAQNTVLANCTTGSAVPSFSALFPCVGQPYVDVTDFGARAIDSTHIPQTTASITGSTSVATLAAASTFINGDGVVIYGAGATNTMSTPSAPAVTPSVASALMNTGLTVATPAGSTSYAYEIEARDLNGGLTAASSQGSTTTGVAALGTVSGSITSMARSGNTVTVTMAAAFSDAVGGVAYIVNSSDSTFSGYYTVVSRPDSTHFTYIQGVSTVGGATATSTGGTAVVYLCNHISWAAVTGAFQYYIYGRASGSLTLIGASRPGDLFFDDYGAAATASIHLPSYVSSTPSVSASNDNLSTTIVSGAGTTSVTLANPAVNTVGGATFLFDDGPGILAAANAARSGLSLLHFPNNPTTFFGYQVNSVVNLGGSLSVLQSQAITLNETMEIGASVTWMGDTTGGGQAPQFGYSKGSPIFANAYPAMYLSSANGANRFSDVYFNVPNQGLGILNPNAGFNFVMERGGFVVGSSNNDYTGMGIALYGAANVVFNYSLFSGSSPGTAGAVTTPIALLRDSVGNPTSNIFFDHCYESTRGIAVDSSSANPVVVHHMYAQGLVAPMATISVSTFAQTKIRMDMSQSDTSNAPMLAFFGPNGVASALLTYDGNNPSQSETGGFPPSIDGTPFMDSRYSINTGQNLAGIEETQHGMRIPFWSPSQSNAANPQPDVRVNSALHFPAQFPLYFDLPAPTGLNVTATSGGSIAAGTYSFEVTATGYDGGETVPGVAQSCTTSAGTQTCALTWTAEQGAASYSVYASNGAGFSNGNTGCTQIITTSCTFTALSFPGGVGPPADTGTGRTSIGLGQAISPAFWLNSNGVVSALPSAAANTGKMMVVTDSTAISAEGQTCVGSGTAIALAFSNGTIWKCF
jgi:hypothetical protein